MPRHPAPFQVHLLLPALLAVALLASCVRPGPYTPVADLHRLPQHTSAYLDPTTADTPIWNEKRAAALLKTFRQQRFAPWHRQTAIHKADDLFWGLQLLHHQLWGENLLPLPPSWAAGILAQCRREAYSSDARRAMATSHSALRLLPSAHPAFRDPRDAGEGYPFDILQNSGVWAGTPLYVTHLSADGGWALVEAPAAAGWMPVADLGFVSDRFAAAVESLSSVAVVREGTPLADASGLFRYTGHIGMLLPADDSGRVFLPVRQTDGSAALVPAGPGNGGVAPFPLNPTPRVLAELADQLMGQPYGWGGLYQDRDCSSLMLDLFTPLGLGLPRNSRAQASAGTWFSLKGPDLSDDSAKEQAILDHGRPFATLVRKPGHIMLYLGSWYDGSRLRPVVLHAMWGLRSNRSFPTPGRKLIGSVVVTTLTPGRELAEVPKPGGLLIHGVTGLTLLPAD